MSSAADRRQLHDLFVNPSAVSFSFIDEGPCKGTWAFDRSVAVNLAVTGFEYLTLPHPEGWYQIRRGSKPVPAPGVRRPVITGADMIRYLDSWAARPGWQPLTLTDWSLGGGEQAAAMFMHGNGLPVWIRRSVADGWTSVFTERDARIRFEHRPALGDASCVRVSCPGYECPVTGLRDPLAGYIMPARLPLQSFPDVVPWPGLDATDQLARKAG